jgi:hypothetical protein
VTDLQSTPIFVLGLTQRSGTNLLYRALLEHPDCRAARQPGEDFLLYHADMLTRYVSRVAEHWNPAWNPGGARADDLARSLGRGLVAHLRPEGACTAFVSKTPSAQNVELLSRFVPDARVLLILRDGRDVAESGVRSFGWTYGGGFRRWAAAGELLVRFLDGGAGSSVELIRFERLIEAPGRELRRALLTCGLDPESYPFDAVSTLPLYGSSTHRGGRDELHWEPVDRPPEFDPVGRWREWDDTLRLRYDQVCGEVAERLGYPRDSPPVGRLSGLATRTRARLDRR